MTILRLAANASHWAMNLGLWTGNLPVNGAIH